MREADLRQLRRPEEWRAQDSKRSTMNAARQFAAAALAGIVFSCPADVRAMPNPNGSAAGREEGRGNGPRTIRSFEFSGGTAVSSNDGVTAKAGMLPNSSEISARYGVEYSDKNGLDVRFTFRASADAGRVTHVFVGAEKTVVVTEKSILVTDGYRAVEEKAREQGGGGVRAGCVEYQRPEELMGEGLVSGAVVEQPGGNVLLLFGRNGWLRALSLDATSPIAFFGFFEPSADYELLDAGSLSILARPGSDSVYAIYASLEGNRIEEREIALFADSEGHPLPEGTPRISGNGRDIILSFDNMEFLVMVGEPGNPHSVTVVSTE
ncbi:MAG: hypothetical protein AB1657_01795 [Candidatus Micrarchaeota archaeon]